MAKRSWSAPEVTYLHQNYRKVSTNQIADQLHRTTKAIESKAQKLGLIQSISRVNPAIIDKVKSELFKADLTRGEIADRLHAPFSSLYNPLIILLGNGEVGSYTRKDCEGLGRPKVVYHLIDHLKIEEELQDMAKE